MGAPEGEMLTYTFAPGTLTLDVNTASKQALLDAVADCEACETMGQAAWDAGANGCFVEDENYTALYRSIDLRRALAVRFGVGVLCPYCQTPLESDGEPHITNCVHRTCKDCGRFPGGHPNDFCARYIDKVTA